jgi:hypothetical protein
MFYFRLSSAERELGLTQNGSSRILTPFVPSPCKRHKGEGKRFLWTLNPGLRAGNGIGADPGLMSFVLTGLQSALARDYSA